MVVASCGFQRATASISPESATTSEYSRRDSRFESITKHNTGGIQCSSQRARLRLHRWKRPRWSTPTTASARRPSRFCFAVVGLYLWQRGGAGPVAWALMAAAIPGLSAPRLLARAALGAARARRARQSLPRCRAARRLVRGARLPDLDHLFLRRRDHAQRGGQPRRARRRLVARLHRGRRGAVGDGAARGVRAR